MFKDLTLSEIYNKETPFESLVPGTGIVLIGGASIGPSMLPVKATDTENAIMIFGVDSQLANAYMEARMSGASDVYLVRINGKHAETNVQNAFKLVSLEAVSNANYLQYEVITSGTDRYLTLMNPVTGFNSSYYLTGKTISQLVSEINIDAMTFQSPAYAVITADGSTDTLIDEYFSDAQTGGADPEFTKIDFSRVVEVLEYLEAFPVQQIGILSHSFDLTNNEGEYFYSKLTEFAERRMRGCMPCIITVGVEERSITSGKLYDIANSFSRATVVECPVSEFINVILARPVFSALYKDYISNGVAAYCGLVNSTDYYEGTTNKRIYGATADALTLTDEQKADLAGIGYVLTIAGTFNGEKQVRIRKGVNLTRSFNRVVDLDDSTKYTRYIPAPMSNIANVKLIQHIIYQLNDVLQVDEPTKISTLKARIEEELETEAEYIKEYRIDVTESYEGFTRTYVVGLELTPVGELSSIDLSMQTR